jgi:hypothetical protein
MGWDFLDELVKCIFSYWRKGRLCGDYLVLEEQKGRIRSFTTGWDGFAAGWI